MNSSTFSPKWGTLGRAQDRASAASRNDVCCREPRGPQPIILKKERHFLPIQFVEVVTTVWHSHTYSFVML
jgi:hypothetical protein